MAGQLEALGLAARQRGNRLAKVQVAEARRPAGAQGPAEPPACRRRSGGLVHRQVQHIGDRAGPVSALAAVEFHLQHLGAVASAVAFGAAQIDIAKELHLDMLETVAATGGAAAVAGVETEGARRVAPLQGQVLGGKEFTDGVEGADIAGRIRPGGLARWATDPPSPRLRSVRGPRWPRGRPAAPGAVPLSFRRAGKRMSCTSVDFPDPLTPVRQTKRFSGMRTSISFRLFSAAPSTLRWKAIGAGRPRCRASSATDFPAAVRVIAGQRVLCLGKLIGRAEENDLASPLARPRPHIQHAVGGTHHLGIVFHHQKVVPGVAQPLKDVDRAAPCPSGEVRYSVRPA